MEHEPCASRGDCYHSRGARNQSREAKVRGGRIGGPIGARNQPREAKVRAGRIGARKMNATWGKTPEAYEVRSRNGRIGNREAKARGGRNGGLKTAAMWGKTPEAYEAKVRAGRIGARKTNTTWGKTPEAYEVRSRAGRVGGPIGGTKTAEIHHRQKPNRQEATVAALLITFHPDVWADIIWQRRLPNSFRGVPDIRHPIKVIGEYDGGAHHWFGDRSENDAAKDQERRMAGYIVIRETDPYILVAKFAYAVRQRFR